MSPVSSLKASVFCACLREQKTGDLHNWCKFHVKLSKQAAGLKNSIRAEFQLVSPKMLDCFGPNPFTQVGLTFMKKYTNPHKLLRRGSKRVIEMLSEHSSKDIEDITELV